MKIISEETPTEESQGDIPQVQTSSKPTKGQASNGGDGVTFKVHTSNKEKLMARLPNLKVSISGKKEKHAPETPDALITPEGKFKSDKNSSGEKSKSDKKKSGKMQVASAQSHPANAPSSPSPTLLSSGPKTQNGDGFSFNSKNIESLEQVPSMCLLLNTNLFLTENLFLR